MREHLARIDAAIAEHNWAVQHVLANHLGSEPQPPYSYSIGLSGHGLPEFVVFGIDPEAAQSIINDLARKAMADQRPPQTWVPTKGVIDNLDVVFVALTPAEVHDYLLGAVSLSAETPRALQIVWPDTAGRFPWQFGFEEKFRPHQPCLGSPPQEGVVH